MNQNLNLLFDCRIMVAAAALLVLAVTAITWRFTGSFYSFGLLSTLLNTGLLLTGGKSALGYVLFPFANAHMNYQHHLMMNDRMCADNKKRCMRAAEIIRAAIRQDKYQLCSTLRDYKEDVQTLRTLCEYAQLFSDVNRELIEGDKDKKRRRKSTRRYPISKTFIRATECLETIRASLSTIRVQSISEIKHREGVDLPEGEQRPVADPSTLRTLHEHFHEISEMERQHLDVREYRVPFEQQKPLNIQAPHDDADAAVAAALANDPAAFARAQSVTAVINNMRREYAQRQMRSKFDRALPRVYMVKDEELLQKSQLHRNHSEKEINKIMDNLLKALEEFSDLCEESAYPVSFFGLCRSRCCCCMTSLFHEAKQMGLVLGKSFKGAQVWIPSIPKQIQDIKELN